LLFNPLKGFQATLSSLVPADFINPVPYNCLMGCIHLRFFFTFLIQLGFTWFFALLHVNSEIVLILSEIMQWFPWFDCHIFLFLLMRVPRFFCTSNEGLEMAFQCQICQNLIYYYCYLRISVAVQVLKPSSPSFAPTENSIPNSFP
jgi:hypothetical protein